MRTAAVSLSTGRVAHDGDRIVLQYWYFYYDDVYSYPFAPTGAFWQAHEGDWEVVNVVLSEDEEPLSVGYSQHSLGQTRSWDDTLRFDGTHPIVHVALSSHANYFTAGLHTFNQACVPLPVPARDGSVMPIHQIGDDGRTGWGSPASGASSSSSTPRRRSVRWLLVIHRRVRPSISFGRIRWRRSGRGLRAELRSGSRGGGSV